MTIDQEAVLRGYRAFNRRDLDGILPLLDEGIVYRMPLDPMSVHPVFRGLDGVRRFYETIWEAFEEYRAEVESVNELNDAIVVSGRIVARPRGADRAIAFGFAHFWRVRGHRAVAVAFHDAVNPLSLIEEATANRISDTRD